MPDLATDSNDACIARQQFYKSTIQQGDRRACQYPDAATPRSARFHASKAMPHPAPAFSGNASAQAPQGATGMQKDVSPPPDLSTGRSAPLPGQRPAREGAVATGRRLAGETRCAHKRAVPPCPAPRGAKWAGISYTQVSRSHLAWGLRFKRHCSKDLGTGTQQILQL